MPADPASHPFRHRAGGRRLGIVLGLALLPCAVPAAVTLPGGDVYLDGSFVGIGYGATGAAYMSPYLYVGELASTESPQSTGATTNLSYGYSLSGLGSPTFEVTYVLTNDDPVTTFTDLRFIVNVQPDGSGSYNDQATEVPHPWGAAAPGDPSQFQIATYDDNLYIQIPTNNGLDSTDTCGGTCDVDFGLQWNVPQLAPGEQWMISVALSDDGTSLSSRYLQAISADTANTALTFSGSAVVVPLPPAFGLLLAGVAALGRIGKART